MELEASMEAGILGWVATHPEGAAGRGQGRPLIEVLAAELGLEPNPETLDQLASALATLEREERIVLDGPVVEAREVAPLDLARPRPDAGEPTVAGARPQVQRYTGLADAPWHVQLNWAIRQLAAQADPASGEGEIDLRTTVTELGLNPKDVRHDLEALGLLHRVGSGGQGPQVWWVDADATVTAAAVGKLRAPAPAPSTGAPQPPAARPARTHLPDLGPVLDSLTRLEPRLSQLIKELVDAAESLNRMALSQSQLLREMTQEIEALRQDRDTLMREVAELRRGNWTARTGAGRVPAAEGLSAEAAALRTAQAKLSGAGTEISDKMRRAGRSLRDVQADEDGGA
ncbi:MAG: hypothetical protein ACXV3F_04225 [Frankiaceae bacterium]